jgi:high-affinity iron transporter
VIIPGIVGIIAGSLLGVLVYYSGHSIKSLKWFFIVSAGLLMFIAAGMVINGTAFFTGAKLFGIVYPYEWRPWSNLIVWDATGCCNPNTNQGWALLRALFGWQADPTNLGVLYWGLYWVVTIPLLGWKAYNGTLTDKVEAGIDDFKSFARHGVHGDFDSFKNSELETQPEKDSAIKTSDMESGSDSRAGSDDNSGTERVSMDENGSSSSDNTTTKTREPEEKKSFVENSKAWWHNTLDSVFKRSKAPASVPQEAN